MSFGIPVRNGLGVGLLPSTAVSTLRIGGRPALILNFVGTTSLDSRVTFTRSTTASFVGSNGLIQTAAINAPRFDYDPVTLAPKGLLIEEQRTNLLTYSEQFDDASWTKARVSITANATAAPSGTTSAERMVEDATLDSHIVFKASGIVSGTHALSVYAKADSRNWLYLETDTANTRTFFNLSTGVLGTVGSAITATISNAGNGWYRCTIAGAFTGNLYIGVAAVDGVAVYTGNGTSGIFLWGAQLEAGAFATSYIPTVASQVTRNADVASMTGTNFSSWYNQSEGTFVCGTSGGNVSTGQWAVSYDVTGPGNEIYVRQTSATALSSVVSGAGSSAITISSGASYTSALAYKLNDCGFSVNGSAVAATSATPPAAPTALVFGALNNTFYLNKHITRLLFYNTRLPNTTLQVLSA